MSGEETFVYFEVQNGVRTRDLRLPKQAVLTTAPGPLPRGARRGAQKDLYHPSPAAHFQNVSRTTLILPLDPHPRYEEAVHVHMSIHMIKVHLLGLSSTGTTIHHNIVLNK